VTVFIGYARVVHNELWNESVGNDTKMGIFCYRKRAHKEHKRGQMKQVFLLAQTPLFLFYDQSK
jgi:hypothetical protein